MKNYALYLIIYSLLGLLLCLTDWVREIVTITIPYFGTYTSERYNFIDFIDTPFYFFGVFVWVYYNVKLSKMQSTYFKTVLLYLIFKYAKLNVGYTMFFVWNYIILSIPLWVYIVSKINYDRFKR
jgi:hypothetical protein